MLYAPISNDETPLGKRFHICRTLKRRYVCDTFFALFPISGYHALLPQIRTAVSPILPFHHPLSCHDHSRLFPLAFLSRELLLLRTTYSLISTVLFPVDQFLERNQRTWTVRLILLRMPTDVAGITTCIRARFANILHQKKLQPSLLTRGKPSPHPTANSLASARRIPDLASRSAVSWCSRVSTERRRMLGTMGCKIPND